MKKILQFILLILLLALSFFAEEKLQGTGRCLSNRSRSVWEKVFGERQMESGLEIGSAGIRGDGSCRNFWITPYSEGIAW